MAKNEILIKAVVVQGLFYGAVAARYGVSKSLVHKLHHRWLREGDAAFEERSRRPRSSPTRVPDRVRDRIITLRDALVRDGLDAGADTITAHLAADGTHVSRTTTPAPRSSASSTTTTPPSSPSTPANSSQNSPSTPPRTTNAKTAEPPKPGVQPFTMS